MTGSADTYVYGVVRRDAKPPAGGGVDEQAVSLVVGGELAALVSGAPAGPVKASRRNLMAHTSVLQAAMAEGPVLPMRFGVVMPGEEAVASELLEQHEPMLAEQLEALEDKVELELKVLCPEDELLRAVVAERPQIRERQARLQGRPDEATYYERIELGELVAVAVATKRDEIAQRAVATLEPLAVAARLDQPATEQVLASAAFLVERRRVSEFDAAVDRLGEELGSPLLVKCVGPLPAYHFVDLEAQAWA
jgi:hypothetical protein